MGKKKSNKEKKYFTLMETAWRFGAPLIVAIAKTLLENRFPMFK